MRESKILYDIMSVCLYLHVYECMCVMLSGTFGRHFFHSVKPNFVGNSHYPQRLDLNHFWYSESFR